MASKNLGAVIQRAISDGAFRRQLQSDPAAALRGFNLSPDEVAAIRSGDSSKLMSLGVDQRMSKAFTVGASAMGGTRAATSDLGTGATSNALVGDQTAGTRDGIVADPNSGTRDAATTDGADATRAIHDDAPADLRSAATADGADATRAVNDSAPFDSRADINESTAAAAAGRGGSLSGDMSNVDNVAAAEAGRGGSLADMSGVTGARAVNDVAPFGSTGSSAVEDPNAPEFRAAASLGDDTSVTRAVHDSAPFEGNVNAAADPGSGDPYSGQYVGVSPDFQAQMGQAATGSDAGGPGGNMISADDNYSVAARMAEAGTADVTRAINDTAPFDSGIADVSAPTGDIASADIQHDPGTISDHGDALGNTAPESGNEHGWG